MSLPRLCRHAGRSGLALVFLTLLVFGGATVHTERRMARRYTVHPSPIELATDDATLARGRELTIETCVHCHGDDLGGKLLLDAPLIGTIFAPNLTSGRGPPELTNDDFVRAARYAVRADGRPLIGMPALDPRAYSEHDLGAIIAYVRSRPAVRRAPTVTRIGPLGRLSMMLSSPPPAISGGTPSRFVLHVEALEPDRTERPRNEPAPGEERAPPVMKR